MKLSLYSLSAGSLKPAEVISLAKKYRCEGIEWWCKENGHLDTTRLEAAAREVAALMKDSGLALAGIAPYFKYNETREQVEPVFAAANIIGAPKMRCHSYVFDGDKPYGELLAAQRKWLEEIMVPAAQRFGVQVVIEQHHYQICCTPNGARQLVDGLPPENIGVIYDPGNSLYEGYTPPEYAISVLGEYLAHVHVKAARPVAEGSSVPRGRRYPMEFGTLEKGDIDWESTLAQLKKAGYRGFLSLEALDGRDPETKVREDIPFLQGLLSKLG